MNMNDQCPNLKLRAKLPYTHAPYSQHVENIAEEPQQILAGKAFD